jgi:hypothetical protein
MKHKLLKNFYLFYISIASLVLASCVIGYAISNYGFVEPWPILVFINLLGYFMAIYIYITE